MQLGSTIGTIITDLVAVCVILCAHYLAQIRDILKDIRDGRRNPERTGYASR